MKIENKLKIAFVIIVVVVSLLMFSMFYFVLFIEVNALEAEYGMTGQQESILNVAKVIIPSVRLDGSVEPVIQDLMYFKPFIRIIIIRMVVSAIVILSIVALLAEEWIKTSILMPVSELTVATNNIKEGNLDIVVNVPRNGGKEITTLCENFNDMRGRLKESQNRSLENEAANRELVSNISHDLKTPVTSIKGYAEGIMDGVADTPEKLDRYIRTIYNKANDLDRLINELTFYSGIDENRIPYNFTKINITDYFNDCVEELSMDLESGNTDLEYENGINRETMIIADPIQMKKVVNNIIGNSLKYMDKEKGKIRISLKDADESVLIEIADNGKGIDASDLPYIFDRFYRTDTSRNSAKGGSGIGLSIVKKIVEDHGGRIWAASRIGEGTVMNMEFRKYIREAGGDSNE